MKLIIFALFALIIVLALRAGLVLISVAPYKIFWEKVVANQPKKPGSITLVALGDSAAQGVGATNPKYSYVGRIAAGISEQTLRPVKTINISVSGAKIADVTNDQIPKLEKVLAKEKQVIVTLDIGTNDVTRGSYEGPEFTAQLDELFSKLPKETIVADIPYLGKSRWYRADPHIQIANTILRERAAAHGLQVVPLYEELKKNNSWRIYSGDFFHPSDFGYEIWSNTFRPAVNERLKQF